MPGRIVINGRYELDERPLARGGMGEVWIGRDLRLERDVAVKFIRFPDGQPDAELTRRFVRESRIAAKLEHAGVPAIFDAGNHEGRPFLVMQRVHGLSVADLNAEHAPLPVSWAAAIAAQVCGVLAVAHRAALIHRDIKPSNLMLGFDGSVKVLDFGLAVALDPAAGTRITRTGQTLGTPAYMAPEQILGHPSTPQTDLYGLGCTLFEMLTGKPPFTGDNPYRVMNRQVDEDAPAASELRPDLADELDRLVRQLLRKRPEERPASAATVYGRLLPFVGEPAPIPGVHGAPSEIETAHMYPRVLAKIRNLASSTDPLSHNEIGIGRNELDSARRNADQLVGDSRYREAAEVLGAVVDPASRAFGPIDDDVVSLRRRYADVLMEAGAYRPAARQFRQLARDLITRFGSEAEAVLDCRMQAARCHALLGETTRALVQLNELLGDQERLHGSGDPRTIELRRQIELLEGDAA